VEELLAAAMLEEDGTATPVREVDLGGVAHLAAVRFRESGQLIVVDVPDPVVVLGDDDSLRHVVDNLIDNALKHGSSPVIVRVERGIGQAVLSVIDHGRGVPAQERERVFEHFHRLRRQDDQPGLGLGLPIVRGLVTAFGGRVWFEDAPGGGAAFRVSLPLAHANMEAAS